MPPKLKYILWEDKTDKQGMCPVALRINYKGRGFYNTGIKCLPAHWLDGVISSDAKHSNLLNTKLSKMLSSLEAQVLTKEMNGEPLSVEIIKNILRAPVDSNKDFIVYCAKVCSEKNPSTKRRYEIELEHIKKYTNGRLTFAEITHVWLNRYYKHITVKNSHNTAINAFKLIRHTFVEANKYGIVTFTPFRDWEYPKYIQPVKGYLTIAECTELYEILNSDAVQEIKTVTAFFLLECYSSIRYSDWAKFSVENVIDGTDMVLTTTKTDTPVRLPIELLPDLKKILDYIQANNLKYTYTLEYTNRMLKTIAPLAGITKRMTTHLARHTFASLMLQKGVSKAALAEGMGITMRTVETYAKGSGVLLKNELKRISK